MYEIKEKFFWNKKYMNNLFHVLFLNAFLWLLSDYVHLLYVYFVFYLSGQENQWNYFSTLVNLKSVINIPRSSFQSMKLFTKFSAILHNNLNRKNV